MGIMEEQAQMLKRETVGAEPGGALVARRRPNRGCFKPEDPRINRRGRPRKGAPAKDHALQADRLKVVRSEAAELLEVLGYQLDHQFPGDCKVVAARLDGASGEVVLTVQSDCFALIGRGTVIPPW
jgi:hypothetical protein